MSGKAENETNSKPDQKAAQMSDTSKCPVCKDNLRPIYEYFECVGCGANFDKPVLWHIRELEARIAAKDEALIYLSEGTTDTWAERKAREALKK